ncbi:hypothetical protein Rsub_10918 [Raphidocelis subcapitata]|uniref:Uncharacterized protein n=1 Tax=Raphidocelis subcapitata TaxID=307507 RepID=A0A2V0PD28_9CHLO|nr:hypothetical protein Rsub_10918 [Raphidocelis subcapitata]|eukprot:GBF97754.1 hypothetical protein Rsub_10918 [Raphidocelis subcapitata]
MGPERHQRGGGGGRSAPYGAPYGHSRGGAPGGGRGHAARSRDAPPARDQWPRGGGGRRGPDPEYDLAEAPLGDGKAAQAMRDAYALAAEERAQQEAEQQQLSAAAAAAQRELGMSRAELQTSQTREAMPPTYVTVLGLSHTGNKAVTHHHRLELLAAGLRAADGAFAALGAPLCFGVCTEAAIELEQMATHGAAMVAHARAVAARDGRKPERAVTVEFAEGTAALRASFAPGGSGAASATSTASSQIVDAALAVACQSQATRHRIVEAVAPGATKAAAELAVAQVQLSSVINLKDEALRRLHAAAQEGAIEGLPSNLQAAADEAAARAATAFNAAQSYSQDAGKLKAALAERDAQSAQLASDLQAAVDSATRAGQEVARLRGELAAARAEAEQRGSALAEAQQEVQRLQRASAGVDELADQMQDTPILGGGAGAPLQGQ